MTRLLTIALVLALAAPARAECRVEGPDTICPTPEFDQLMDHLDDAEAKVVIERAESKRLDKELAAARDRASVTHPEPKFPVVEFVLVTVGAFLGGMALAFGLAAGSR